MALEDGTAPQIDKTAKATRQRDLNPLVFNPGAGRLPPPEAMEAYAAIDATYPQFLKEVFIAELKRTINTNLSLWSPVGLLVRCFYPAQYFWRTRVTPRWRQR